MGCPHRRFVLFALLITLATLLCAPSLLLAQQQVAVKRPVNVRPTLLSETSHLYCH